MNNMTDQEFRVAIAQQQEVLAQIRKILDDAKMSLSADFYHGTVWLRDDGRDIRHTGFSL